MANHMIGIRGEALASLKKLCRRKRVSQQGLISALAQMACGEREDLGIIDLDWEKIREECPTTKGRNRKTWSVVIQAVRTLMEEFDSPEEIAMRSRFTLAQVSRAMEEIRNE